MYVESDLEVWFFLGLVAIVLLMWLSHWLGIEKGRKQVLDERIKRNIERRDLSSGEKK